MLLIEDFRSKHFEDMLLCYQNGFPNGHNRYSLARLVRFQKDTIFVAVDQNKIVGVIIGVTSYNEAWMTGMTVLPEYQHHSRICSLVLLKKLGERLIELNFKEAYATTARKSVKKIAEIMGATLVAKENNFYFDGQSRWIFRSKAETLSNLNLLLPKR